MAIGYAKEATDIKEIKDKCPPKVYEVYTPDLPLTNPFV